MLLTLLVNGVVEVDLVISRPNRLGRVKEKVVLLLGSVEVFVVLDISAEAVVP